MTGETLLQNGMRAAQILLAGVVVFLLLSIFSSDPSPDTERESRVEKDCRRDWKKCAGKEELLKNWNYELKTNK